MSQKKNTETAPTDKVTDKENSILQDAAKDAPKGDAPTIDPLQPAEPLQPTILDESQHVEQFSTGNRTILNENGVEVEISATAAKALSKLDPKTKFVK